MKFPKDEVDSNNNEYFWCIRTVKGDDDTTLLRTEFVSDQLRKVVTHSGYQQPITVTDAMTALQLIMDDPQMAEDFEEQFKQSTATPVEKSSRAIFRIVKLFFFDELNGHVEAINDPFTQSTYETGNGSNNNNLWHHILSDANSNSYVMHNTILPCPDERYTEKYNKYLDDLG
jgi:hypothetical protein